MFHTRIVHPQRELLPALRTQSIPNVFRSYLRPHAPLHTAASCRPRCSASHCAQSKLTHPPAAPPPMQVLVWDLEGHGTSLAAPASGGSGAAGVGTRLQPLQKLEGHSETVEDVCWRPGSTTEIASVGEPEDIESGSLRAAALGHCPACACRRWTAERGPALPLRSPSLQARPAASPPRPDPPCSLPPLPAPVTLPRRRVPPLLLPPLTQTHTAVPPRRRLLPAPVGPAQGRPAGAERAARARQERHPLRGLGAAAGPPAGDGCVRRWGAAGAAELGAELGRAAWAPRLGAPRSV